MTSTWKTKYQCYKCYFNIKKINIEIYQLMIRELSTYPACPFQQLYQFTTMFEAKVVGVMGGGGGRRRTSIECRGFSLVNM